MIILPAIDLKDGKCVRLTKGEFSTVEKVAEDALQTAIGFEQDGAEYIHMVDLDGAKNGVPVNHELILEVAQKTSLKVEIGGGIRDMDTIDLYLSGGVERVILGSAALQNPALVRKALSKYDEKIVVGIDAKEGEVKASGWLEGSAVNYMDLAHEMVSVGVSTIIFTDINRDGTLSGPNFEQLENLYQSVDADIIASGGIRDLNDLQKLKSAGIAGAILGKSIYRGTINLKDAIKTILE